MAAPSSDKNPEGGGTGGPAEDSAVSEAALQQMDSELVAGEGSEKKGVESVDRGGGAGDGAASESQSGPELSNGGVDTAESSASVMPNGEAKAGLIHVESQLPGIDSESGVSKTPSGRRRISHSRRTSLGGVSLPQHARNRVELWVRGGGHV